MSVLTSQAIDEMRTTHRARITKPIVKVGMSTCGIAAGAQAVYDVLAEEIKKRGLPVRLMKCGCLGMCYAEPLVEVQVDTLPRVIYGNVDKDTAVKIIDKHVAGQRLVNDHIIDIFAHEG